MATSGATSASRPITTIDRNSCAVSTSASAGTLHLHSLRGAPAGLPCPICPLEDRPTDDRRSPYPTCPLEDPSSDDPDLRGTNHQRRCRRQEARSLHVRHRRLGPVLADHPAWTPLTCSYRVTSGGMDTWGTQMSTWWTRWPQSRVAKGLNRSFVLLQKEGEGVLMIKHLPLQRTVQLGAPNFQGPPRHRLMT